MTIWIDRSTHNYHYVGNFTIACCKSYNNDSNKHMIVNLGTLSVILLVILCFNPIFNECWHSFCMVFFLKIVITSWDFNLLIYFLKFQVITGSTRLVTPDHVMNKLFSHRIPRWREFQRDFGRLQSMNNSLWSTWLR